MQTFPDKLLRDRKVAGTKVTGTQVKAFYDALPDTDAACAAVGAPSRGSVMFNQLTTILRRAGVVSYDRAAGTWNKL